MYRLMIITVSTREGRKGPIVSRWIESFARQTGGWDIDAVDLKALSLPMLDEPEHPRLRHYHFEHTKAWSARVEAADAFIAVTPEYNFGAPPSLINALDYVLHEWAYKPMAFVSYGGVSGGTRSVQMLKQIVTSLKVVPIFEAVSIPFFTQFIDAEGRFNANEQTIAGARAMLSELRKWAVPLQAMRQPETRRDSASALASTGT